MNWLKNILKAPRRWWMSYSPTARFCPRCTRMVEVVDGECECCLKNKPLEDLLESQEFYELCQAYRMTGFGDQRIVVQKFNDIKDWIRKNYKRVARHDHE